MSPEVHVYTYAHVRTEFMKLELLGLATATIKSSLVEKVIEYGIPDGVLDTLLLYLHDDKNRVHGQIRIKIDWKTHKLLIDQAVPDGLQFALPASHGVQASTFKQLTRLFNDYAESHGLRYWFEVLWTESGGDHDKNCGITRSAASPPLKWLPLESVEVTHPILAELDITAGLHVADDTET